MVRSDSTAMVRDNKQRGYLGIYTGVVPNTTSKPYGLSLIIGMAQHERGLQPEQSPLSGQGASRPATAYEPEDRRKPKNKGMIMHKGGNYHLTRRLLCQILLCVLGAYALRRPSAIVI